MKRNSFADLKSFLGIVFHPDWTIEHESADHAIRKFARRADDRTRKAIIADILRLQTDFREEELENFICEDCKGDIFPPALGFTYSNWLKHASETISSTPMTRRSASAVAKDALPKKAGPLKPAAAKKAPLAQKSAPLRKK